MSGTHGQHGVNAARNVEVVKGKRPGLLESKSYMEALCAVAAILRKNHATIIPVVSFSIHISILKACPNSRSSFRIIENFFNISEDCLLNVKMQQSPSETL